MKLIDIAQAIGAQLQGDPDYDVRQLAPLGEAGPGQLSFLASSKYRRFLAHSRAGALILSPADADRFPGHRLLHANPYAAYARAAQLLYPPAPTVPGVHPSAVIAPDARLHPGARVEEGALIGARARLEEDVWIGPGVVVEADCEIGPGTRIHAKAVLYAGTRLGARCIIHGGAVIGADGFGFAPEHGAYVKIPQLGGVRIGNDVEVGANTTIDRGALGDTVIEDGVKLDNLVQVAHNVCVGAHTVIAGQTGIAGSTQIGRHCVIGGQVGIAGHLRIADQVVLSGKSMVTNSIERSGVYSSGLPLQENALWRRSVARFRKLEEFQKRLEALEEQLQQGLGKPE